MARRKNKKTDLENNRYGLFMNENSFDLDVMYGRHYLNADVNFLVKIYRINRTIHMTPSVKGPLALMIGE